MINNAVFGETMENVKKHIKFVTTEERNNYLISESKYHATNFFSENELVMKMKKKTQITHEETCLFRLMNFRNR